MGYKYKPTWCGRKKVPIYKTFERDKSYFEHILISPRMFLHHIPDSYVNRIKETYDEANE